MVPGQEQVGRHQLPDGRLSVVAGNDDGGILQDACGLEGSQGLAEHHFRLQIGVAVDLLAVYGCPQTQEAEKECLLIMTKGRRLYVLSVDSMMTEDLAFMVYPARFASSRILRTSGSKWFRLRYQGVFS